MDNRIDFDINEYLKQYLSDPASIATPEADSGLVDCEHDPEALTTSLVDSVLNCVIDSVAENPEAILRSSNFDSLQLILKCAPVTPFSQQSYVSNPNCELFVLSRSSSQVPSATLSKILDLVVSTLSAEADIVHNECDTEEQESIQQYKYVLEALGFLLQWTVAAVETKTSEKSASVPVARGRGGAKGSKTKSVSKDVTWDPSNQLPTALEVMSKVMKLKLSKIFLTTSERDTFVSLFTRPVYLILESETRTKSTAIRMHCFKVLCIAIKHHGHAYGNGTELMRNTMLNTRYRRSNVHHTKSHLLRTFGRAHGRTAPYPGRTV